MATVNKKTGEKLNPSSSADQGISNNLESFTCFWLDQQVNSTQDNLETQKQLRHVINHLQTFDSNDRCEKHIRRITKEKVVLIVSGSAGREVVPRLHDLAQLSAVYVFCKDQKDNEKWANKYHKVIGIFVERAKLLHKISEDQVGRGKTEEGASISVITPGSQSLQARNAMFLWFQLFIEVLLRMHHKSNDRKELLDICKNSYQGNFNEMKTIDEFEKVYKAENAIWWYTRESCFYRMLNKALRVQDIETLFALRFFITDIAKQINTLYEQFIRTTENRSILRVYRGQTIGSDELTLMKNSIGEFLSMNSFLSTSINRSTAVHFAGKTPTTVGFQKILFEITINPRSQTKPFANISRLSYFNNEGEVLIMLGALFRINRIYDDRNEGMWVVQMSLASEDDFHLKEIFSYMKNTIGNETDLDSLGKILIQMGEIEQARKCYGRMLDETKLILGTAESGLGLVCLNCNEVDESLKHFSESLQLRQSLLGKDHADVGECYSYLGTVHWYARRDYEQALAYLTRAVEIQEKTLSSNSLALAKTYHNVATTYDLMKQYDMGLEYYMKALEIRKKVLPNNHPEIAVTFNNLGKLYECQKNYKKALEYFEKSAEIKRKIFPPTHEDVIVTENNILKLKEKMKK